MTLLLAIVAGPARADAGSPSGRDAPLAVLDRTRLGKFFPGDPGSPAFATWLPFLTALSANDAIRRSIDDEAIAAAHADAATARRYFGSTVIRVVAEGLRRVGDADLLAARPLIARFVEGPPPCSDESVQAPVIKGQLTVGDELRGLEPVLTRAVEALNARQAPMAFAMSDVEVARERSLERLGTAELTTLLSALSPAEASGSCEERAVLNKVFFESAPEDAPALLRSVLQDYSETVARTRTYRPGQSIEYPTLAEEALVTGTQRVRFRVDASGTVRDVTFIESAFAPETVPLPDGTVLSSRALFEAEVRAWLPTTSDHPPTIVEGVSQGRDYEIPLDWRINDADPRPPRSDRAGTRSRR